MRIEVDPNKKKYLIWISRGFIVTAIFLIAQLFWVCEPEPHWKDAISPQCTLTKQVVICQLVTDIFSDLILMLAPLSLIRNLQDIALRRRLTLIFSSSIATTIVSLVHAAFIFQDGGSKVLVAAFVENTISLIVCNLPVVAAAVFRLKSPNETSPGDKHLSSVHFKSSTTGNRSRSRGRRTNTVDITTTIALDELHDHDHDNYDTGSSSVLNTFKSVSVNVSREVLGTASIPGVPSPVRVVGYAHRAHGNWDEGPDSGTPFGSYFNSKGSPRSLTGDSDQDPDKDGDSDGDHGQSPKPKRSSSSRLTPKDTQSQTHISFAEMPKAPR